MTIVRRSNRVNASTSRRSPRLSKCSSYGSRYSYCSIPKKSNTRKRNLLKIKVEQSKKQDKSASQGATYEVVLKMLRSRPIIKKEYYQLVHKKNVDDDRRVVGINECCSFSVKKEGKNLSTKAQLKRFSTPKRMTKKSITSPPSIRRSNRKTSLLNGNDYLAKKYIDFELYQ